MAESWKGMTLSGSPYDPYVREVWKTLGTADEGTNREQGFDSWDYCAIFGQIYTLKSIGGSV